MNDGKSWSDIFTNTARTGSWTDIVGGEKPSGEKLESQPSKPAGSSSRSGFGR